jgi:hypothetical protein
MTNLLIHKQLFEENKDQKSHTRTRICYNRQKPEVWSPPRECVIKIYYLTPAIREFKNKIKERES